MKFADFSFSQTIQKAIAAEGYHTATPIQEQAIPHILKGHDVLGCAQTGTGKTAAFALPELHRLISTPAAHGAPRRVRCLALCPTREPASQIAQSFKTYGHGLDLRTAVVFGGVNIRGQADTLRRGVDILIATPGRLLDLVGQRMVDLGGVQTLILDEADRMLDMGFIHDIRRIIERLPRQRQNLMFSATMPQEIRRLADSILRNPVAVQVAAPAATAERIDESVYFVAKADKPNLLAHLVNNLPMSRAIVFTRTKHGADRVVRHLNKCGIHAEAIHGNKSQNARERALSNFRAQKTPVLVATDIASRGIDIDDISHVVNFDISHEPETYVHRIGRTARAGAAGSAVSFCDREEVPNLKAIERLIRRPIPVRADASIRQAAAVAQPIRPQPVPQPARPQHHQPHQSHQPATHRPAAHSTPHQGHSQHRAPHQGQHQTQHQSHPSHQAHQAQNRPAQPQHSRFRPGQPRPGQPRPSQPGRGRPSHQHAGHGHHRNAR